jgi:ligand-binding sensor domain-containing protein
MKKHQVFKIGLHVLLVFHITFIYGQIQPSFQHITTEDGLVSNSTLDIFQDHIGFLWIGMYYGLQRFDGYQYKTYICNLKFPDTVNFGGVVQTLEDSKGNLWIATNNFGILKFDRKTNTFNYFVHDPNNSSTLSSNHIYHCFLDSYDILWVMHGLGGFLDRLDTKTGTITRCRNYPDDPNSISHNVVSGTAVSYWKVKAIYEDKVGDIWIGTHGGGLNRFNRDKNTFSHFRHNPSDPKTLGCDTVMYILEDDYGNLWIATWGGGLDQYIRMSNTFKHHIHNVKNNSSLANDYCYYIFREDSDNLWVSVLNGFDHLSVASGEFSHFKHGQHKPATLIGKFYLPFYIDENRNLWVFNGEFGVGIAHLILYNDKEGEVQYYYDDPNNPEGLRGLHIGSVIQDYTGIIWIPATPRGIDSYDPYKQYFHQIHHQPYNNKSLICNNTKAILESKFYEGVIWIGTHEGLELYNRKTNTFTHISCNPENPGSISNKFVTCLHEDRDGRLWIGTSDGLYCYNYRNQWFTIYKHDQQDTTSIGVHTLWNMIEDHEGNLWITSLDGVLIEYCRGEDQFNNYRYTFSEPVNTYPDLSLWCVFEDNDYNIWVGSTNGLSRFERNKKRFNYVLKGISVHVIFPDDENNFWLGTALNGLCHFNRQTGETVFYDETKGLCNNAIHAIIDDKKGNLWIATEGGLSRFNIQSRIFTNFYKEHGLPTELFDWQDMVNYHRSGYSHLYTGTGEDQ